MSEAPHAVTAPGFPGTVIETGLQPQAPASTTPAFTSPTDGMSASQAAAMRFVDSTRAALARDLNNQVLAKQHRAALDHAVRGGPKPDFIAVDSEAAAAANPTQTSSEPADMTGEDVSGFAHLADTMAPEEIAQYRAVGVNLGLHPAVSETMATMAAEFGIPRAIANDIQQVAVGHFGGPDASDSIPVLDEAALAEMQAGAVAKYGAEVIADLTTQARQVLADKGLLQKFDELGLTNSSMAFDRRTLRSIIFWGKMGK
jgi:hypothetical protein